MGPHGRFLSMLWATLTPIALPKGLRLRDVLWSLVPVAIVIGLAAYALITTQPTGAENALFKQ